MIFWERTRFEWRVRTRSLPLGEYTHIVGVVNVAHGGAHGPAVQAATWAKVAVASAVQAFEAGADIVELVVEPGRGHAPPEFAEEEQWQLLPVLEGLMMARPEAVVAVDVHHAATARAAARLGAEILNDPPGLTGSGWDAAMAKVVAQTGCGLVLRHARGRGRKWLAEGPMSSDEVVPEAFTGLCERMMLAESAGIAAEQIVADPGFGLGFGMGRRAGEDMALLAGLGRLRQLGRPLLVGVRVQGLASNGHATQPGNPGRRASVEWPETEDARRTRTIASQVAAILAGVHLLRVHDVAAAREAVAVADAVLAAGIRE
jgi:dihydropteroate synthase